MDSLSLFTFTFIFTFHLLSLHFISQLILESRTLRTPTLDDNFEGVDPLQATPLSMTRGMKVDRGNDPESTTSPHTHGMVYG